MQRIDFELRGEHIPLDALLKATGLAASGGGAKAMIGDGRVQVDGRDELRKTCKIRAGQVVAVAGARVHVNVSAPDLAPEAPTHDGETDLVPEAPARDGEIDLVPEAPARDREIEPVTSATPATPAT